MRRPLYRCNACGNKTRFDVVERKRVRAFVHFTLGGEAAVEDEEILEREVERVECRWCGSANEVVPESPPRAHGAEGMGLPSAPEGQATEPAPVARPPERRRPDQL